MGKVQILAVLTMDGCLSSELYDKAHQDLCQKIGKLENQAISFCDMAYCYTKIGKYILARTCYEKGLQAYLDYFGVKRYMLLKGAYNEKDSYKRTVLAVFASHLYDMATFEQDFGSKTDKKEYLLMSAHCGKVLAKEEYKRIYGRYY